MNLEDNTLAAAWLTHCLQLRREITKLQEEYDRGVEFIKHAMGDDIEAAINGTPVITWAPSKPAEYIDARALKADHPELAAQYTKVKAAARPFRILEDKA